jgi:hypothetical protein
MNSPIVGINDLVSRSQGLFTIRHVPRAIS